MMPAEVFAMVQAVEQAMLDEAIPQDRRKAVINRLVYGDRRGFIRKEERSER
jgi:hypothetical protein